MLRALAQVPSPVALCDLAVPLVATFTGIPPLVEIRGDIDAYSAPGVREELLRVIRHCGPQLALDLAEVSFIDCAGVSMLLATRRRAGLEGGSLEVVRVSPRVERMISLLGLGWAFGIAQGRRPPLRAAADSQEAR
jgi:anti-sigma B factor antagonist